MKTSLLLARFTFLLLLSANIISCYAYDTEISFSQLKREIPKSTIRIERKDNLELDVHIDSVYASDSILVFREKSPEHKMHMSEIRRMYIKKMDAVQSMVVVPIVATLTVALFLWVFVLKGQIAVGG